ncbi:phage terminase large subunit [Xylella taiwanensis]|uniref:Terminase n=2 Tax=Xylella taiwanensis TaxID=1444770 RepID=Z9JFF6_9GAMM|nr:phage terminase large subunit [Xylella taiwanensis]EWS77115.1 terminase [Xylella taiwanensis]UFN12252.1 phage terminase large subunit [Xylella taiwanensis]UFN15839.1 phage terminase large subunit [Xylella taiwanensis]UFN30786.1 phage terminase large subunit [Xylella taiwanensis]UFS49316.1 phage terminase large subunit [Xylella taiwanensis]
MAEVKAAIQAEPWLTAAFEVGENYIRTTDRRVGFAFIGLRRNLDSIKSKARILLLWVDEAESVSEAAWEKAIPTVREEHAEIWVTWNPEHAISATHLRFREHPPERCKCVALNWRDNPFFPDALNRKRLEDLNKRPDSYAHIWEGAFRTSITGAYYSRALIEAKDQGRIGFVATDPLMTLRAYWDIGGTGAKADACAIWIAQLIGTEVRVLDYYEAIGQPLATHVNWLRRIGTPHCILPHDGATHDRVFAVSYASALKQAGFEVAVIPNMGPGAAAARIEATRRMFPSVRFNETATQAGRHALNFYHEKRDANRNIGLGPHHDWSSHAADAFGLIAIDYEKQRTRAGVPVKRIQYKSQWR